jgi:hypothetical protein
MGIAEAASSNQAAFGVLEIDLKLKLKIPIRVFRFLEA